MNTKIRIITVLISAIFLISGLTVTFFATEGGGESGGDIEDPIVTPSEDPVTPEPTSPPVTPDPTNPPVTPDPTSAPVTPSEDNTGDESGGYIDDGGDNGGYYTPDSNGSYDSSGSAGSVTNNTNLWEVTVDEEGLKESQWSDIKLDIEENKSSDVSDFKSIKNDDTSSVNFLGLLDGWLLTIGITLLVLSAIGFTYYGVSRSNYKKKLKRLMAREQKHRESHEKSKQDYGDSEYPTQADYNKRYQKNRYASTPYQSKSSRSSKFDTAELPARKYKSRH